MVFKFPLHNTVMVSQNLFSDNEDGLIWPKHTCHHKQVRQMN